MDPTKKTDTEYLTKLQDQLAPCFELDAATTLRSSSGDALDKAARRELLRQVLQGEPVELVLEQALTFRQSATPRPLPVANRKEANANFTGFVEGELGKLARSFRGRPFLRDHNRWTLSAVGGVIEKSEAVEVDGWTEFRMSIRLQARWAVEAALDGTLRTFSIGWDVKSRDWKAYKDSVLCSVCGCSFFSSDCGHRLGQEVKHDDTGERFIVEALFRNVRGAETSGVSFPAVAGTGIEDIRAALAAGITLEEDHDDMKNIAKILGLADDATEGQILEALKARENVAVELKSQIDTAETLLASEKELHAATTAELATARESLKQLSEQKAQDDEDALIERALAEGRIRPADKATEKAIRTLAKVDIVAAKEFVGGLAQRDPIARELDTQPAEPPSAANNFGMTEQQLAMAEECGLSPEEWARHNLPNHHDA